MADLFIYKDLEVADINDFVNSPVQFMTDNIVQVTEIDPDDPRLNQQPVRVTLHDTGLKIMNKPNGKLFELFITTNPATPAIDAYFCPYQNDKSFFVTLDNDADFMFTPQMAGCSFGVGSQNGGVCRVGHVNFISLRNDYNEEAEKRERMYSAQNAFLRNRLDIGNDRVIKPSDYRGPDLNLSSTTFGVRQGGTWSFKTLRYNKPGAQTFLHHGIHDQVNN